MNLSDHLTLEEFVHSATAADKQIDNTLPADLLPKAIKLAAQFEQIRSTLGCPIKIDSGYRCPRLNLAVRGVKTSQHCLVEALDLVPLGVSVRDAASKILEADIGYDQLIFEGSWLHYSCKVDEPENNRSQILIATFDEAGKASYTHTTRDSFLKDY